MESLSDWIRDGVDGSGLGGLVRLWLDVRVVEG